MSLRHGGTLQLHRLAGHAAALCALRTCWRGVAWTATPKRRHERVDALLHQSPNVREWCTTTPPEAVISRKMQHAAERFVADACDSRSEKLSFYVAETRRCTLCGERLQGGYTAHSASFDHVARLAVVRRALGMILTLVEQAVSAPSAMAHTTQSDVSARQRTAVQAPSGASSSSCFHTSYEESPLFDAAGVPPREALFRRPQALKELDLVDALVQHWWSSISQPSVKRGFVDFDRLTSLSSNGMQERRWRLRFLLHFLRSRGVLRFSLSLRSGDVVSRNAKNNTFRSEAFQRFEMVGDASLKRLAPDRTHLLFPADEGGMLTELQLIERTLDSNFGLLSVYDYLGLDELTGVTMANNKGKADVVEAVIGELEVLLASSEVRCGGEKLSIVGPRATTVYLRAVVAHTLNELWHALLMWRIETTLGNAREFVERCVAQQLAQLKVKQQRRTKEAGHSAMIARLPRYALMPALLQWERPHPGVRSVKDEALYALSRTPARLENASQHTVRQLAVTSMRVPASHRERHTYPGEKRSPREWLAGMRDLVRHLPPSRAVPAAAALNDMETSPETLSAAPAPAPARLPEDVAADLATRSCVVVVTSRSS